MGTHRGPEWPKSHWCPLRALWGPLGVQCIYIYKVVASVCLSVCLYLHNLSLGGRRQKPIGALNSAGIGEGAKPKKFKILSSKIGEVWKELKMMKI